MKEPLINWNALEEIMRPPMPPAPDKRDNGKAPGSGIGGWDNQADFYNQMAQMEAGFTLNQINCFDTDPEDTVLDVGCGPGRITVPMAKRAKAVTALDASPKMLEHCRRNAEAAGLTNVTTRLFDWEDEACMDQLEKHDIVIASRSVGMGDINRLAKMAKKYVVLIIWSHGCPSIPMIVGELFRGIDKGKRPGPHFSRDRRLGNNLLYNRIYDMGYNPNLNVVEDGFTKDYESRQAAYEDLIRLKPDTSGMGEDAINIFKENTDKFLTELEDGRVRFLAPTKSIVVWFKPQIEE